MIHHLSNRRFNRSILKIRVDIWYEQFLYISIGRFIYGKWFCCMCLTYVPSYLFISEWLLQHPSNRYVVSVELEKNEPMSDGNFCTSRAQIPATIRICFRSISFAITSFDTNYDPAIDTIGAVAHTFDLISDTVGEVLFVADDIMIYSIWWIIAHFTFKTLTLFDSPSHVTKPYLTEFSLAMYVMAGVLSFLEVFVLCVIFGTWAVC